MQTQHYSDGSRVEPAGRDDIRYYKADGRSANVYVPISGPGVAFDCVVAMGSMLKWDDGSEISEAERSKFLRDISKYRYFRRRRIGVSLTPEGSVQPLDEVLRNSTNDR